MTLLGTDPDPVPAGTAGTSTWDERWESLLPHRDSVVRLARSRGAGADAEDVAQEAMLRAASNPGLDLGRVRSYLAKIAANLVIDLHRRSVKEQQLRAHTALEPCPQAESEAVEDRDLARQATRIVSGLAPELRTILLLRRDGATWSQVGRTLGEPPATAEMRYRRAVLPLRRRLQTC
jgi:RNA polymerase sigma factor (sigma-70 family)